MLLLNFKFNKSLFKILINKPIGVTTRKNIITITKGETILPNNKPNLNQILFNGYKIFEFNSPRIKNAYDKTRDHTLNSPLLINGYAAINKKTTKNIIPKLLLEPILISSI